MSKTHHASALPLAVLALLCTPHRGQAQSGGSCDPTAYGAVGDG